MVLKNMKGLCYKISKEKYTNFYDSSILADFQKFNSKEKNNISVLSEKTKKYTECFDACDVEGVCELLCEDAVLFDPNVGEIKSRVEIRKFISGLFSDFDRINFVSKKIISGKDVSVIEFILTLDEKIVSGVDIISWVDGKIKRIDAYLNMK